MTASDDGTVTPNIYAAVCVKSCPQLSVTERSDCFYLGAGAVPPTTGTDMNTVPYGSHAACPYSSFNTDLEMIDTYCLPNWEDGKD
jgi:hypothetical protein